MNELEILNQLGELVIPFGLFVLILIIGWIAAKLLTSVLRRILKKLKIDRIAEPLNRTELLSKYKIQIKPSVVLAKFIFWLIMLVTLVAAANYLQLDQISALVMQFIAFLPELLKALTILLAGIYIASLIKNVVGSACKSFGIKSWNAISSVVFSLLLIIIFITTLEQLNLETALIADIVRIVVAGAMLAFAIAYGMAAKNVLASILSGFYSKNKYAPGQVIEVDGMKGTIIAMDGINFTLDMGEKKVVLPLNRLVNEAVVVYSG